MEVRSKSNFRRIHFNIKWCHALPSEGYYHLASLNSSVKPKGVPRISFENHEGPRDHGSHGYSLRENDRKVASQKILAQWLSADPLKPDFLGWNPGSPLHWQKDLRSTYFPMLHLNFCICKMGVIVRLL